MMMARTAADIATNSPGCPWRAATTGTAAIPIVVNRLVDRIAPPITINRPATTISHGRSARYTPAAAATPRPAICCA